MFKTVIITFVVLFSFFLAFTDVKAGPELCPDGKSINTGIGCIPVESPAGFITTILRWATGIAGGIAFILIVYAGFEIITAGGNPQKVQAGRELLTAAIMGLMFLLFSAFILRFFGVDLLGIPGL
jgi:hypothetical protein